MGIDRLEQRNWHIQPMEIRYFATIRDITGESKLQWKEPATTLSKLLCDLCARYDRRFRSWVLDGDDLGAAIIILINGRDARHLNGINTPLQPDDTVSIFPMVAGGQSGLNLSSSGRKQWTN